MLPPGSLPASGLGACGLEWTAGARGHLAAPDEFARMSADVSPPAEGREHGAASGGGAGGSPGVVPAGEPSAGRWALVALVHVLVLSAFAFAQPLFDVLTRAAAFFVARGSTAVDVWGLTLGLVFVLPLAVGLVPVLVGLVWRPAGKALQLVLVAALVAVIAMPLLTRAMAPPGEWVLTTSALVGVLGAALYARWGPAQTLLTFLAFMPPLVAGKFLFDPNVTKITAGGGAGNFESVDVQAEAPVVFIIMDELPLYSLLTPDLRVDEQLFPHFGALAADSTWFRNASAVHDNTAEDIVALVTGNYPTDEELLPIAADLPRSLFTLLGRNYRINSRQAVTDLVPDDFEQPEQDQEPAEPLLQRLTGLGLDLAVVFGHTVLPEVHTRELPSIGGAWSGFLVLGGDQGAHDETTDGAPGAGGGTAAAGAPKEPKEKKAKLPRPAEIAADFRAKAFQGFNAGIDANPDPALYFLHVILPHSPWIYMPSGTYYPGNRDFVSEWGSEEWVTSLEFQRHLLQLGATDKLLGETLDRLRAVGKYDEALIVVIGDHGVCFRPDDRARLLTDTNVDDVLRVPLFVKRPFQREQVIDDRNFEHPDLLPTMADALGIPFPWDVDGHSGLDPEPPERPTKRIRNRAGNVWEVDGKLPESFPALDRKIALFGPHPTWDDILAFGTAHDLVGRPVADLDISGDGGSAEVRINHDQLLTMVDKQADMQLNLLKGRIRADDPGELPEAVAIALNGVVCATTPTYGRTEDSAEFDAMVDSAALRPGDNEIAVYALDGGSSLRPLTLRRTPVGRSTVSGPWRRSNLGAANNPPKPPAAAIPVTLPDGRVLQARPGMLEGSLFAAVVEEDVLRLVGWSADVARSRPADSVVVVLDGKVVFTGTTGVKVDWPPKKYKDENLRPSGFVMRVPLDALGGPFEGRVRVYGVSGNRASEVTYATATQWLAPQ